MSEVTPKLCQEAVYVASSSGLKALYIVRLFLSLLGIVCMTILIRKKGTSFIPNRSAKVLYIAHTYFSFHISFFFLLVYAYQIYRTSISSDNPCSYVIDAQLSALVRMAPGLGIQFQTSNMFTFALERGISTLYPLRYERVSSNYFGLFLLFVSIGATLAMNMICVYLPIKSNSYVSLLTARNAQNAELSQFINIIPLFVECGTLILFTATYYLNKSSLVYKMNDSLGGKYQISENKKIISILLPCFVVHCLLNLFSYGALSLYPLLYPEFNIVHNQIFVEVISQAQTYSIVLPFIILLKTRRSSRVDVFNAETASKMHFRELHYLFNQ